jgi:ATP-dependent RNA helicase UAP56/SUB2
LNSGCVHGLPILTLFQSANTPAGWKYQQDSNNIAIT